MLTSLIGSNIHAVALFSKLCLTHFLYTRVNFIQSCSVYWLKLNILISEDEYCTGIHMRKRVKIYLLLIK